MMQAWRIVGLVLVVGAASRVRPAQPARDSSALALGRRLVPGADAAITAPRRAQQPMAGGDAKAIADGAKLYVAYNCVDCHGVDGTGLMAPSLSDNRWRYGGSAAEVFASISGGRPEGMPRWSRWLSADQIGKLTAYVRSLGSGKDVATLSFTDLGVKRAGH